MFENWWLIIIPIVFGLGWLAATLELRQPPKKMTASQTNSYVVGLGHLLSENHDAAIDAFIEAAKTDPETTDLHFLLGNLFRRRGEIYRAVRVHQNLVERPDISNSIRDKAIYELGLDFHKAGMFDEAEKTYKRLLSNPTFHTIITNHLIDLFQLQKDWDQAIAIAEGIEHKPEELKKQIAHFYCEKAEHSMQSQQWELASQSISAALEHDPSHPRASLLQVRIQFEKGMIEEGINNIKRIGYHQNHWASLVAKMLINIANNDFSQSISKIIFQHIQTQRNADLEEIYYQYLFQSNQADNMEKLTEQIKQHPDLMTSYFVLKATQANNQAMPVELQAAISTAIHGVLNTQPRYTCQNCGFRVRHFYWQCPGCNHWDSYSPQ